ncbi:MAG: ABC transporter ATP-binding protein [Deltaproteobacteria bacterium]|nr:ABC transporter ATP-binding protein [Deltaproteobacteria bacterium]
MPLAAGDSVTQRKIVCENISRIFVQKGTQRVHVLEGINLEVDENEFLVILGPGQSGKSTLLRIIAGLETPTTGRVLLGGKEVAAPGPDRGLVFQRYTLFPWKTVMGNVEVGPKLRGMGKKERRELAARYIRLVGLEGFENAYPHQLSGGMKQRVGIARAYINDPQVMLLDEPFGQLDAQTRYFMEKETIRIWESEKRTVLFVTNNIDEAIYLGDRIITLEGKLPGRMKSAYKVDLPRPREHTDAAFLEMRQRIIDETQLLL